MRHGTALRGPDHAELQRFTERRLAPVLEHDARRKNKLLPTLQALCEHGWHKADAARALHLQRQALYHRAERIERLLAADLNDPSTRLGLELALRARQHIGTEPPPAGH
jgi:purine catabolism regulator